jgi:voltage-gated potassium channel Kch
VDRLLISNADFMVIDFNPVLHEKLAARGVKCLYGDISHADVLQHAGVDKAKVLVCSISDDFLRGINNRDLLEILRRMNPHAAIIVTADSSAHALELYELGADYVVLPRVLAADDFMSVITLACGNRLVDRRQRHKAELESRLTAET